jgi:hypothetical protein
LKVAVAVEDDDELICFLVYYKDIIFNNTLSLNNKGFWGFGEQYVMVLCGCYWFSSYY